MVLDPSGRIPRVLPYSGSGSCFFPLRLRDSHPLSYTFPCISAVSSLHFSRLSYNPGLHRFGLLRFRSPLLTESFLLSFPAGTQMFHFPASRSVSSVNLPIDGFPHSDISGSFRLLTAHRCVSPFAASFFARQCLGILHTPFFAFPKVCFSS